MEGGGPQRATVDGAPGRRPVIGFDASRLSAAERTGTEQYTAELLRALLTQPGDERYRLYTNRPAHLPPLGERAAERSIPFPRLWTHLRLAAELRRDPPDLLFVPAHVLPLACPVPAVVTVHDLGYLHFPRAHPWAQRLYLHLGTRWSVRTARRVIAVSGTTRDELVRHYRVPAERIDVVHHGLAERFRPPTDRDASLAAVERLGLRRPYLLAVGTVQPRKNYPRLVAALAHLRALGHDLQLVIVGRRGWLADESFAAPAQYGVASHVHFAGYVPDAVLPALYSMAAAVVFPSVYEGLGLPALEALACGANLVCSSTSAFPEMVGESAVFCDPVSVDAIAVAIAQALSDAADRERRCRLGLAHATRFTWERCASATLASLRRAMAPELAH